jgi:hypothetical protein
MSNVTPQRRRMSNVAANMWARILPPKPCRRMAVFTVLWSCLFFLLYRVYSRDDLLNVAGSTLNTRELLQKEIQVGQVEIFCFNSNCFLQILNNNAYYKNSCQHEK